MERTYHAEGELHQVKYAGNTVDTRLYDDGGRLEKSTYGNGVVTDWTYFDDNNTETIAINDANQNSIDHFTYTYDDNKNVTSEIRTGTMASHSWNTDNSGTSGYDDDDRLTYWKLANNSINHNWSLSDVGDWDSFTNTGVTQTRAHNSVHEISSITESGNTTNLVHDVKGNLTTNANTHTYDYDFDNRMKSVDTDGDSVADISFEYDALGRSPH